MEVSSIDSLTKLLALLPRLTRKLEVNGPALIISFWIWNLGENYIPDFRIPLGEIGDGFYVGRTDRRDPTAIRVGLPLPEACGGEVKYGGEWLTGAFSRRIAKITEKDNEIFLTFLKCHNRCYATKFPHVFEGYADVDFFEGAESGKMDLVELDDVWDGWKYFVCIARKFFGIPKDVLILIKNILVREYTEMAPFGSCIRISPGETLYVAISNADKKWPNAVRVSIEYVDSLSDKETRLIDQIKQLSLE
jgi:hypothetical protein